MIEKGAFVVFIAVYCVTQTAAWPQDMVRTANLRQRSAYIQDESYQIQRQQLYDQSYNPSLRYHQRRSHVNSQSEPSLLDAASVAYLRRTGIQSEPGSQESDHLRRTGIQSDPSVPKSDPPTFLRQSGTQSEYKPDDLDYQSDQSTQDFGLTTTRRRPPPNGIQTNPRTQGVVQKVPPRRPPVAQSRQSISAPSYGHQQQNTIGRLSETSFHISVGENQGPVAAAQEGKPPATTGNITKINGSRPSDAVVPTRDNNTTRDDLPSSRRVGGQAGINAHSDKPIWNRVKLPDEGGIVFPGQGSGVGSYSTRFIPRIQGHDGPSCAAAGMTFCDDTVEGYPAEYLTSKLRSEAIVYRELFGNDVIPPSADIAQRIDVTSEDQTLCLSSERIIYPTVGQNRDDQWLFIVNHAEYQQGVRIETCINEDGECQFSGNFAQGYTTFCKQKYIYRKMLALNMMGDTNPDTFKLPSCCVCHIRSPGAGFRMLVEPAQQSPAPKRRRRAPAADPDRRRK